MSTVFGAHYVRTLQPLDDLRRIYKHAETAGQDWVACEFGDNTCPIEAFGQQRDDPDVFASGKLSARFGEAIYLYCNSREDELLYDHSRAGKLLRKLMWVFDGATWAWTCVAGEPEPWEDVLFAERNLAAALDVVEPEDQSAVRAVYEERRIVAKARWPSCDASMAGVVERHFGIVRPARKR